MASVFDNKIFNPEVFQKYVERIPNLNRNELVRSRAIRPRPELASAMSDNVAGNYITTPLKGLISGAAAQNYDGNTNLSANGTKTFSHSRVVVGRANAWTEKDFSYDITGGMDFIENIAQQISEYWEEVDQATIVHVLNGVFNMSDEAGLAFIDKHTNNICAVQNSEGVTGKMDGTTLNTTMQKACGDNKGKFSLAIMHSAVATNLENLRLLAYLKYTDASGMQRDLAIGTLNGRTVLVDDNMPTKQVEAADAVVAVDEVKGVYTLTVTGAAYSDGEKLEIKLGDTTVVTYDADGAATAANIAKTLRTMCAGCPAITDLFTVSGSSAEVVFTQKVGGTGAAPTVSCTQVTSGTIAASVATTTPGVAAVAAKAAVSAHTEYTTYVLGDGAIEYTDCGAKVPYEVDRDPAKNGGEDTLYSRQRKCFAPYGISFTKTSMTSLSPTDLELENGANWELVNDNTAGGSKEYIAHKAIPIARIISLG